MGIAVVCLSVKKSENPAFLTRRKEVPYLRSLKKYRKLFDISSEIDRILKFVLSNSGFDCRFERFVGRKGVTDRYDKGI